MLEMNKIDHRHWREAGKTYLEFFSTKTDSLRRDLLDPLLLENLQPRGKAVLDIGCGEGYFSRLLLEKGAKNVVGVDVSADLIDAARRQDGAGEYRVFDVERDDVFGRAAFDAACANLMLMDLKDLRTAFQKIADFLKPRGRLVASIVNPYYAYPVGVWKRNPRQFLAGNFAPALEIRDYFNPPAESVEMPETDARVPHFHHKFSEYLNLASEAELVFESLAEPQISERLREKYADTFLSHQLAIVPIFQILTLTKK